MLSRCMQAHSSHLALRNVLQAALSMLCAGKLT